MSKIYGVCSRAIHSASLVFKIYGVCSRAIHCASLNYSIVHIYKSAFKIARFNLDKIQRYLVQNCRTHQSNVLARPANVYSYLQ